MDKKTEVQLTSLTIAWDDLMAEMKRLEEEKANLRQQLIDVYDEAIKQDFPYLDDTTDQGYEFVNPVNGLVYKRSIAEVGTKFDINKWIKEEGDDHEFIVYHPQFDERRAQKLAKQDDSLYERLAKCVIPGKKQIRIYQGTKPTEDNL